MSRQIVRDRQRLESILMLYVLQSFRILCILREIEMIRYWYQEHQSFLICFMIKLKISQK